jgi:hypothetical protein
MQVSRTVPVVAKEGNRVVETLDLIVSQGLAGSVVSGSEVTHQSIDSHVAKWFERDNEFAQVIEANSEPAHAGVNLYVNVRDHTCIGSSAIQRVDHVNAVNNRRQSLLNAECGLSRPVTSETEHWLRDPCCA